MKKGKSHPGLALFKHVNPACIGQRRSLTLICRSSSYLRRKFQNMQQEDDLRGLEKVMQFMRGISVLFLLVNFYWFCYGWLDGHG